MGKKERQRAKQRKKTVAATQEHKKRTKQNPKPKAAAVEAPLPFEAGHRALLVGEGDFSFSCAMTQLLRGDLKQLVATALDSQGEVRKKYPKCAKFLTQLQRRGAAVRYGVDCTKLQQCLADCVPAEFDRIVFNFPHSGQQRVHVNRALLRDFFESALDVLAPGGQVIVTLKDQRPYSSWLLDEQAASAGFRQTKKVPFNPERFPVNSCTRSAPMIPLLCLPC